MATGRNCATLILSITALYCLALQLEGTAFVSGALSPEQTEALLNSSDPIGSPRLPSLRVLITAIPYAAHSLPLLRLGQELASRGHRVWFASSDDFVEMPFGRQVDFAALGLTWLPLGRPPLNASQRHERDQLAVEVWQRDPATALRTSTGLLIQEFHELFCRALLQTHGLGLGSFDVVLMDMLTTCALDYAQYIGAPLVYVAATSPSPLVASLLRLPPAIWVPGAPAMVPYKMSITDAVQNLLLAGAIKFLMEPVAMGILEDCRTATGLVRQSLRDEIRGGAGGGKPPPLVLVPSPPGFEPPVSLPPHVRLVGGMLYDPPGGLPPYLSAWLDAQPGLPVVYVAFGTLVDFDDAVYDAVLTALGRVPARVLWAFRPPPGGALAARLAAAPANGGGVPANVRLEAWVPQLHVLRHGAVRAVVSHGGFSSVAEAMYCGKPVVAIPAFGDNDHNAWRLREARAGLMLNKKSRSLATELEAAIDKVLTEPSFTAAARRLAVLSRTAPGVAHAAALVESVAALGSTAHLSQPDNTAVVLAAAAALAGAALVTLATAAACCAAGLRWARRSRGRGAVAAKAKRE